MVRPNWIKDHPDACTCVTCTDARRKLSQAGKVGRNEKCPCGSKKKYKRCHGR